ncbi:MAG: tetratricopeptide repeat protein [Candidatus Kapabacteria bacterium]|nr:tetratricopeptide repeat protein [Candidatus Kapabacteria bacterium]
MKNIIKAIIAVFTFLNLFNIPVFSQDKDLQHQAEYFISQKKYNEAVGAYTKAITIDSSNSRLWYYRGIIYLEFLDQPQNALYDFDMSINKDSTYPDAYNFRGLAHEFMDDNNAAMDDYNKAINLDPKFAQAYLNRGSSHIQFRDYELAIDDLNLCLKYDKKNAGAFYQRGVAHYKLKEYQKSLDDFNNAVKHGLKTAKVYYNRANSHFKLEHYEKSIDDYTKAYQLDTNDREALNNRAVAYDKTGKPELAAQDREKLRAYNDQAFPPIESIKFATYTDSTKAVSIDLPAGWKLNESHDTDLVELIIYPPQFPLVSVKVSLNPNMLKRYNLHSENEILDFWKGSTGKNILEYADYNIFFQKLLKIGDFNGFFDRIYIRLHKDSPKLGLYELVLAHDDILVYVYYQCPEAQFHYYGALFESTMRTLKVLKR